jgi:hypothetical protein
MSVIDETWRVEEDKSTPYSTCRWIVRDTEAGPGIYLDELPEEDARLIAQAPAMARLLRDLAADIRRVGLESTDPARRGALEIAGQIDEVLHAAGVEP